MSRSAQGGLLATLKHQTMYRLMLWYLAALHAVAALAAALGLLPYAPLAILATSALLALLCYGVNRLLAAATKTAANHESAVITGLILSLITGPADPRTTLLPLVFIAVAAIASKYVLVVKRRHIFNPAAVAVVLSALLLGFQASWWVGSTTLFPAILLGGLVVTWRIRRWYLVLSFLGAYLGGFLVAGALAGSLAVLPLLRGTFLTSPVLFFAFVMLVEPATAPQGRRMRIIYGVVVALLFVALQYFPVGITYGLELALIVSNGIFRLAAPDRRLLLRLSRKEDVAENTRAFWFAPDTTRLAFVPGQYLEWTLPHAHPDQRGVRRYFTIASAPTEDELMLATKFSKDGSSFKEALQALQPGDAITAANLSGEFVLPEETARPVVFIAGGIGVTPFRSMTRWLVDQQRKDMRITMLYANRTPGDVAFRDLFEQARKVIGMKTVYVFSEETSEDEAHARQGMIDAAMIKEEVSEWQEALFYVSGPEAMVQAFVKILSGMGVPRERIKRDYFPGY